MKSLSRLRRYLLPLFLVIWSLVVVGWLGRHNDGLAGPPLVMLWNGDPGMYDPHATSHPIAQVIFSHVCEPLFYYDLNGELRGLLAEDDIGYSVDGRRLTVRLRSGVTFHDDVPLDATAVQSSFERLQRLGLSPITEHLRDVNVTAQPDGKTVIFNLPQPDFEFARLVLNNPYAAIVSPQSDQPATPGFVACTGSYQFAPELYQPDDSLTLVRNPLYRWPPIPLANRGAAHIPQIQMKFIAEPTKRLDTLLDRDGCFLSLDAQQVQQVTAIPRFRLYRALGGVSYLGFNFQRPRWQDARIRQAIAMTIDKTVLTEMGMFEPAEMPLTPNMIGFNAEAAKSAYDYKPIQAQRLLTQAGFDFESDVILLIPEDDIYREFAVVIQRQLAAIGIEQAQIKSLPRSEILSQRQDFDLLLFDYAWGDYTALGIFLGDGPRNLLSYADGDVAALVRQARLTRNPVQKQNLILEAQETVLSKAIWQPLVVRHIVFAVDGSCVTGERQHPLYGYLFFHDAYTH